jgi:4-amino-4-deoxychorismate lyase
VSDFSLIETMRWEPSTGIARAKLHHARLRNSANKLGFASHGAAWEAVEAKAAELAETSRLRLELFADGRFGVAAVPFSLQADDTVWIVRVATEARLASGMPLLRHKTSQRSIHDAARAEFDKAEADEVLLLNEKDEVCEGTITNVFVEAGDDILLTPPLSCGCLAGVLRTSLICAKRARVARLSVDDLKEQPFHVGNSLRGLIRAKLLK